MERDDGNGGRGKEEGKRGKEVGKRGRQVGKRGKEEGKRENERDTPTFNIIPKSQLGSISFF